MSEELHITIKASELKEWKTILEEAVMPHVAFSVSHLENFDVAYRIRGISIQKVLNRLGDILPP